MNGKLFKFKNSGVNNSWDNVLWVRCWLEADKHSNYLSHSETFVYVFLQIYHTLLLNVFQNQLYFIFGKKRNTQMHFT